MRTVIQGDMFAGNGPKFTELVERRIGSATNKMFTVGDVAAVLDIGRTKVLEMIECGRLPAANLNAGMAVLADAERPGLGNRPLRPLWRITREALLTLAREMEQGV